MDTTTPPDATDAKMTNQVFIIDTDRRPMRMASAAHAQHLLQTGQAAIIRREPFTLIMKHSMAELPRQRCTGYTLKIDPGSRYTGFAILDSQRRVVYAMELEHRGEAIKQALTSRASIRRTRRSRNTRYRETRFDNRTRSKGWLAPSIQHRIDTTMTWVKRFMRYAPIKAIAVEIVKFDMELLRMDAEVLDHTAQAIRKHSIKAYLMVKHNGTCVYCDTKQGQMTIDHWIAKDLGGTDNLTNLVLACYTCNQRKNNLRPEVFLRHDPQRYLRLSQVTRVYLKDAAAVNTTRLALFKSLVTLPLPVEQSTGGRTAFNRRLQGLPKTHWIDAACVGTDGHKVIVPPLRPLLVKAVGQGHRQVVRTDKYGFPNAKAKSSKSIPTPMGLVRTGDLVHLDTHRGKYAGEYPKVRIASINTTTGYLRASILLPSAEASKVVDFHPSAVKRVLQRNDGYRYDYAA